MVSVAVPDIGIVEPGGRLAAPLSDGGAEVAAAAEPVVSLFRITTQLYSSCKAIEIIQDSKGAPVRLNPISIDIPTTFLSDWDHNPYGVNSFDKVGFKLPNGNLVVFIIPTYNVNSQADIVAYAASSAGITAGYIEEGYPIVPMTVTQVGVTVEVKQQNKLINLYDDWSFTDNGYGYAASDCAEDIRYSVDLAEGWTFNNWSSTKDVTGREAAFVGRLVECSSTGGSEICCPDYQAIIMPMLNDTTIDPSVRAMIAARIVSSKTGDKSAVLGHMGAKLVSAIMNQRDEDGEGKGINETDAYEI